jgi:hypothetical protein
MYRHYAPQHLSRVDEILTMHPADLVLDSLIQKYGPEPGDPRIIDNRERLRVRLTAMYEVYAPEKVSSVDEVLSLYAHDPETIMRIMVEKYGPEPGASTQPAFGEQSSSTPFKTYRERIIAFYSVYKPDAIPGVDALLKNRRGEEEAILSALRVKYGPEPEVTSAQDVVRVRLLSFYSVYAPTKIATADEILLKFAGKHDDLFGMLVSKYGPEPGSQL